LQHTRTKNRTTNHAIWGGASSDKTYLSDTQILRGANVMAQGDTFFFVKHVNVSVAAAVGNDVTIEVIVNTNEGSGRCRLHAPGGKDRERF